MSGPQLAFLSTVLWVIGTGALFVLLANWSAGGSWGLSAAIVRGVREWSRSDRSRERAPAPPRPGSSPEVVELGDRPTS